MTAPRIPSLDTSDAARLPPLHRILTPEEFRQAQGLTPEALQSAPFPVVPPAAPRDATRLQPDANPQSQPLTGARKFASDVFAAGASAFEHPVETVAGMATAPILALFRAGRATNELQNENDRARRGLDPMGGEAKVDNPHPLADIAQILALGAVGPLEGKLVEALTPSLGAKAAKISAQTILGAGVGAAYNPEQPGVGAVVGAAAGGVNASVRGAAEPAPVTPVVHEYLGRVHDAWQTIFSPAARSEQAGEAAGILRATTGAMAQQYEQATFQLDHFRRAIDPLPDPEKLAFIDAIESGGTQPHPELQPVADKIRTTLDDTREAIRALGTGKLESFIRDYFPHIWQDPDKAGDAFAAVFGKRPMEGSKAFLKQRTIPTTAEGIAMGLEPVTTNPIDLTLLKLREMQRYLMAHESLNQMKEAGLVKFVSAGDVAPDGYAKINDRIATVFGPRQGAVSLPDGALKPLGDDPIPVKERAVNAAAAERAAFPMNYQRLIDHAEVKGNGLTPEGIDASARTLRKAGYAVTDDMVREAKAKASQFAQNGGAIDYSQTGEDVRAKFGETFDEQRKQALGLSDLKPEDVSVTGMRIMGEHWAPEPVARLVNNYLSPGLRGNALYDAYRGLGNMLNQAQLGLSAFHLGFTSMDATVSRAALGLEYLASGEKLEGVKRILSAPAAPLTNAMLGARIRRAYLQPETATPDMVALANAVKEAGGRVRMDSFYQNSAPDRLIEAWKQGEYGKVTALSLPAIFELAAKPIMEHVVPLQKLGIFGDLARKTLAELPDGTPLNLRRQALASAWDSVDNRMGQMVYDNLFWNKSFKDLAMASVRSVGWNLGTIRELGGGLGDLAAAGKALTADEHAELTHRAAYVVALPIVVGLYGAALQYLATGQGPQEAKDYFFPRTGDVDTDGNPERVQLPSYMKDMFAYAGHPWETVKHKLNPILTAVTQMLNNEDYYGDEIRNPDDPATKQLLQEAQFVGQQFTPFAFRNRQESIKRGDQSGLTRFGSWFGVTPAPRESVLSAAQNKIRDFLNQRRESGATPEDVETRQARAGVLADLRLAKDGKITGEDLEQAVTNALDHQQLMPKDLAKLLKRAGLTPAEEKFKRLTLPQALEVFKLGTAREQQLFAGSLLKKIQRSRSTQAAP